MYFIMRIPPKLARVRIFFFPLYLCHSFVRNPTTKTYICPLTTQDVSMLFFVVVGTRCKKFPGESSPLLFFFLKCHFDLFGDAQGPCDIKAKKEETKQQQKKKCLRVSRAQLLSFLVCRFDSQLFVWASKKCRRNLCFDRYANGSRRQGSKAQNKTVIR